jgi:hypothetical protein
MGKLDFTIKGLTEERLRRTRDSRLGTSVLTALLVASLIVLDKEPPPPLPPPTARASPNAISFGEHLVGSSIVHRSFAILNTGTQSFKAVVSFSAAASPDFKFETDCETLEPKESCVVSTSFSTHAVGEQSAELTVRDENGHELALVNLTGAGIGESTRKPPEDGSTTPRPDDQPTRRDQEPKPKPQAALTADPSSVDFKSVEVGHTSEPERIQVLKAGTAQFAAGYVVSGNESMEFEVSGCDGGQGSFFFGEGCTLDVRFAPQSDGPHDAVVTFREILDGTPVNSTALSTIELHGQGLTARLEIKPTELDFRRAQGPTMDLTIRNTGAVPVSVYGAPITGPDANRFQANVNRCRSQPIAVNGQCVIRVTHRISDSPRHTAELVVEHSAGKSAPIKMYWEPAPAPEFNVDRQSIDFGLVNVNERSVQSLTLTNVGNAEATNIAAGFAFGKADSFQVVENGCQGVTLQPRAQCGISVAFVPTREGNLSSTLTISAGGLKALSLVSVTGRGGPVSSGVVIP